MAPRPRRKRGREFSSPSASSSFHVSKKFGFVLLLLSGTPDVVALFGIDLFLPRSGRHPQTVTTSPSGRNRAVPNHLASALVQHPSAGVREISTSSSRLRGSPTAGGVGGSRWRRWSGLRLGHGRGHRFQFFQGSIGSCNEGSWEAGTSDSVTNEPPGVGGPDWQASRPQRLFVRCMNAQRNGRRWSNLRVQWRRLNGKSRSRGRFALGAKQITSRLQRVFHLIDRQRWACAATSSAPACNACGKR